MIQFSAQKVDVSDVNQQPPFKKYDSGAVKNTLFYVRKPFAIPRYQKDV